MYKIKRIFIYISVFFEMIAAEIASIFARRKEEYKNLWIVSERGTDARDNAYHFFKYLRREHPEINSVYIISNDSPDREKVASLGKIIEYGSFRHYLCYILAKVRVSTHIDGYSPDILFFHKFGKLFPDKAKKIFLQHGIIKDDLAFCHAEQTNIDMFTCSAVPEFEFIKENFGYKDGILELTGMCRYDNLKKTENPTKRILFMPTWRSKLRTGTKSAFEQSDYFKKYNSFLNSEKLEALLEKNGYELVFYPHYEIQRFLSSFESKNKRVKIADFKHNDVQDLLINSDILITDYSSVFFDYAYMRKPMVFFQYDEEEFRSGHYKEGYFNYRRDAFGAIAITEDEVISEVEKILENSLEPSAEYLARMNSFFSFNDAKNCERNFEAICKRLG